MRDWRRGFRMFLMRALALLALCAVTSSARAARSDVDNARAAYLKGDFPAALAFLARSRDAPGVSDEQRAHEHWYRALCLLAQGDAGGGEKELDALLDVAPFFEPDPREAPPSTRALFRQRSAAYQQTRAPVMVEPEITPPNVTLTVGRGGSVDKISIQMRPKQQGAFRVFSLPVKNGVAAGAVADAAFWHAAGAAGGVDLVLEAQRSNGTPLARLGDAEHPITVAVAPLPEVKPVVQQTLPSTAKTEVAAASPKPWLVPVVVAVMNGGAAAAVGALGVVALLGVVTAASVLLATPTPRRQPWFGTVLLVYRFGFWAAVTAGGVAVVPLLVAAVSTGVAVWRATHG